MRRRRYQVEVKVVSIKLPLFGCFRKWWYPQIIQFNRDFHYESSILGYHHFWTHPFTGETQKTSQTRVGNGISKKPSTAVIVKIPFKEPVFHGKWEFFFRFRGQQLTSGFFPTYPTYFGSRDFRRIFFPTYHEFAPCVLYLFVRWLDPSRERNPASSHSTTLRVVFPEGHRLPLQGSRWHCGVWRC